MSASATVESTTYFSGVTSNSEATTPLFAEFLTAQSRRLSEIILEYFFIFAICLIGIVSNVLVILVYSKQGFKESVAISMTAIAVWDLAKCTAGAMQRTGGIVAIFSTTAAISWANITIAIFNGLVCFSSYVTSVMAAYVSVERCLCVSIPLKVKWLITPKVTLISTLVISVVVFGCFSPYFALYVITWEYDNILNATIAVAKRSEFYLQYKGPFFLYYNLSGIIWPLASFIVIVISSSIIVYKLRQGSKFRAGNATTRPAAQDLGQQQQQQQIQLTNRDRQVVKMLLIIIAVYIANLFPRISLYMAKYFIYDFYFLRRYHNLFQFVVHWLWVVDFVNGAVNFFIFYAMSSSFKATFHELVSTTAKSSSIPKV